MQVGLTRKDLLVVIQHYADALSRGISDELHGSAMTVSQAGLSNKYIDETVSRMAALTTSLFEPVPTLGFHDQDAGK